VKPLLLLLLLAFSLLFLPACDRKEPVNNATKTQPIPAIDLEKLQSLLKESADKKQVVIIDFWATWCIPCVEMFPAIHEGAEKLGPNVRLITISLDDPADDAKVRAFLTKNHALNDAYILDGDADKQLAMVAGLGKNWDALVAPALFVFGKDGKLHTQLTQNVEGQQALDAAKQALKNTTPAVP
jgi:thiol-disulfide isomerase/thioredoxin